MTRSVRSTLAVLLLAVFAFTASGQRRRAPAPPRPKIKSYQHAYAEGVNSINRGLWSEGIAAMNTAINEDPRERVVLVENLRGSGAYLPHYHRGLAIFQSIRVCTEKELTTRDRGCDEQERAEAVRSYRLAIEAFDESESQGVIRSFPPQYETLKALREKAASLERRLSNKVWDDVEAKPPGKLASIRDAIGEKLYRATYEYRGPIASFFGFFTNLREAFSSELTREEIDVLRGAVSPAVLQVQRDQLARDLAYLRLKRRLAVATAFTNYLGAMNEKTGPLTITITEAGNIPPGADKEEIDKGISRVEVAIADARKVIPEGGAAKLPPPSLFEAGALFFGGDYAGALAVVEDRTFADPRSNAHATLIRAASRHALYLTGSRSNTVLLDRAADDVRRCRELDPAVTPTDRFSPAFREFFAKTIS